jgi:crotonobetainyl-CoA:carnitine CoA-transferase CaiB-like acyl-CoA transferase
VRVLDLSQLLPGPFCTQMFGDLGADVVKVEPPRGDGARALRSDLFATANRNKTVIALDLKKSEGLSACLELAAQADVVVEGFRPGVVDRLGVGYADVAAVNPSVVYCSITGFGATGPRRGRPGHDANYLAAGGALAYPGHWLAPPARSGLPVADLAASCYAAIAILAALVERGRGGTGGHLELAMSDAALAFASVRGGRRLDIAGSERAHLWPTNEIFTAADGVALAVGAVEEQFWSELRTVLCEMEPALGDARFDSEEGRRRDGDELKRLLDGAFAQRPAAVWMELLADHDVPVNPVVTLAEAADEAQRQRGIVEEADGERHVLFPVLRDGAPMARLRSVAGG